MRRPSLSVRSGKATWQTQGRSLRATQHVGRNTTRRQQRRSAQPRSAAAPLPHQQTRSSSAAQGLSYCVMQRVSRTADPRGSGRPRAPAARQRARATGNPPPSCARCPTTQRTGRPASTSPQVQGRTNAPAASARAPRTRPRAAARSAPRCPTSWSCTCEQAQHHRGLCTSRGARRRRCVACRRCDLTTQGLDQNQATVVVVTFRQHSAAGAVWACQGGDTHALACR